MTACAQLVYPLLPVLIALFLLRLIDELLCGHAVPQLAALWCCYMVHATLWPLLLSGQTVWGPPPLPCVPTGAQLDVSSSCLENIRLQVQLQAGVKVKK